MHIDQDKIQAGFALIAEGFGGGGAPPQSVPVADDPGRLLSSAELAAAYGVCGRTVQNWRERGCPCQRISARAYRYDLGAVQAWHARRGHVPAPKPPRKVERNDLVGENPFADE